MIKSKFSKDSTFLLSSSIKHLKSKVVKVGLPASKDYKNYEGENSLLDIAIVHELGSEDKGIAERSFVRKPIYDNKEKIFKFIKKRMDLAKKDKQSIKRFLDLLGLNALSYAQKSFDSNNWEPLKDSTIKSKNSSGVLVDTGNLKQSLTYSVEDK